MGEYIQIFTTVDKKQTAEKIAKALIKERVAGCVQIVGPIESTYWWKGKIEKAKEWLCIVKSKKGLYRKAEKIIKDKHPYEIPEIIAIPISAGNNAYLQWLNKELNNYL